MVAAVWAGVVFTNYAPMVYFRLGRQNTLLRVVVCGWLVFDVLYGLKIGVS
jgi:hypothetical protein